MLDREDSSLGELGGLRNQILLVLGIAALSTFFCVVAGTRCHHRVSWISCQCQQSQLQLSSVVFYRLTTPPPPLRSVGKVCMAAVPASFMLLVTLTIRACLATGGPQGVLLLLAPDWGVLTQPGAWAQVHRGPTILLNISNIWGSANPIRPLCIPKKQTNGQTNKRYFLYSSSLVHIAS